MNKQQAINKMNSYRTFIQLLVLGFKANPTMQGVGETIEQTFEETMREKLTKVEEDI